MGRGQAGDRQGSAQDERNTVWLEALCLSALLEQLNYAVLSQGKDSFCYEISAICVRFLEEDKKKTLLATYFAPLKLNKEKKQAFNNSLQLNIS